MGMQKCLKLLLNIKNVRGLFASYYFLQCFKFWNITYVLRFLVRASAWLNTWSCPSVCPPVCLFQLASESSWDVLAWRRFNYGPRGAIFIMGLRCHQCVFVNLEWQTMTILIDYPPPSEKWWQAPFHSSSIVPGHNLGMKDPLTPYIQSLFNKYVWPFKTCSAMKNLKTPPSSQISLNFELWIF